MAFICYWLGYDGNNIARYGKREIFHRHVTRLYIWRCIYEDANHIYGELYVRGTML